MATKKVQEQNQSSTFGIVSLICSLMSFVVFGIILAPLGAIFGIVSLAKDEKNKGFAIAGIIIGCIVFIVMLYAFAVMSATYTNAYNNIHSY
jgi:drug/metabolite transporter (DMT)-like permease